MLKCKHCQLRHFGDIYKPTFACVLYKFLGDPLGVHFFIICSANAVQSADCMRVDTACPSLVRDYMTGL